MKVSQAVALFLTRIKQSEEGYRKSLLGLTDLVSKVEAQKGDKGDPGESIRGDKGDKGDKGDTGAQGKSGADGKNGKDGRNGVDGKDGRDGLDGKDGRNGLDGKGGKNGKDGKNGRIPRHKIQDGAITFEQRPGVFGEPIRFIQNNNYYGGGGGSGGPSESSLRWIDYATGFGSDPVLTQTIATGDVYTYTYSNGTLYRLVPSGSEQDAFYRVFSGGVLSDLVVTKGIEI